MHCALLHLECEWAIISRAYLVWTDSLLSRYTVTTRRGEVLNKGVRLQRVYQTERGQMCSMTL